MTPKKTWFHFKVMAPKSIRVRLIIENVSIYENMYEVTVPPLRIRIGPSPS